MIRIVKTEKGLEDLIFRFIKKNQEWGTIRLVKRRIAFLNKKEKRRLKREKKI